MMTQLSIEARLLRLEHREAIRELVARYAIVIDERDIDGIGACFAREGSFRSHDGVMNAQGREAVVQQFHGRFAILGPSNHFTHDHVIWFEEGRADRARGLVNSHAELVRHGAAALVALRYQDEYVLEEGRWRFADRLLAFFYYMSPGDYAQALPGLLRNRAEAAPRAADWPEGTQTFRDYYARFPPNT